MAEGAPLLREYGLIAHRGFESLSLRHYPNSIFFRMLTPLSSLRYLRLLVHLIPETPSVVNQHTVAESKQLHSCRHAKPSPSAKA